MNSKTQQIYLSWTFQYIPIEKLSTPAAFEWLQNILDELTRDIYLKYPNILKDPKNTITDEIPPPRLELEDSDEHDLLISSERDTIYFNP
jgi:hypothetical protein